MVMRHMHAEKWSGSYILDFVLASEGNLPNPHHQGCWGSGEQDKEPIHQHPIVWVPVC